MGGVVENSSDSELVDGGIASFGGYMEVGGGHVGTGSTGAGFGGLEGVNTGMLGEGVGFGGLEGVITGMLGDGFGFGGCEAVGNVSARDDDVGVGVGGVRVSLGGK
ncbi:PREDICTED: ctenidin-3-like [Populus euphratica]|uniref:Ctenidin-3-like n=1 Tax=Populus euphratica TaxID=75702 RepID=A0AAJ6XL90_POPEU|nr:PREDICTED: ctenidin-3-like [Populus euphratica]